VKLTRGLNAKVAHLYLTKS